jgi:hypothetical protein
LGRGVGFHFNQHRELAIVQVFTLLRSHKNLVY